ncbi:MAG: Stk1 family PASTA domain-containing Ser/Thr kinase [Lachnospiraceae bacterium]|nr:Stk1 family PASTA domain-containing Ser/Thr kinase [Lachnospiraceae bacterium]
MLPNGTIIANRYEILNRIGSGGTADVYKAFCHKLNRNVAIKVLKAEYSEDEVFIGKFRKEAQSAAGMTNANIVNVYDVGDENGLYYIVMELVEGITLKQYIEKKGPLEYQEALSIAIQICQGIEAAHEHHIIHRDIKPQNIIISKEGKVKVTDFGIAKVTTSETVNAMAMGSVHYISPEQARGAYSDVTSDIYSFGITLYEMVTGRVPFDGETTVAVALMHIQNEIVPPSVYAPNLPVSVEQIILKCTQKRMDRRYQSASNLIIDLKRALVTPYDQFVDNGENIQDSPTVMFTQDQLDQINSRTSSIRIPTGAQPDLKLYFSDTDSGVRGVSEDVLIGGNDFEEDPFEEDFEEQHELAGMENLDDTDEIDSSLLGNRDANQLDKIMVYVGVAVAIVLVVVTVAVVIRVMMTFGGAGSSSTIQPTTAPTSSVVTSTEAVPTGVQVPNCVGMTRSEAKAALNSLQLGFDSETAYSSVVEKGVVISQSVEANTYVSAHTTVVVVVSNGPEKFSLIDVKAMSEAEATEALKELDLEVEVVYENSTKVEDGKVIKTSPSAKSQVAPGDTVTITVAKNVQAAEVAVPDLLGNTQDEAIKKLSAVGLTCTFTDPVASSTVEKGCVVAQNYTTGTMLPRNSSVELTLSSGMTKSNYSVTYPIVKSVACNATEPAEYTTATGDKVCEVKVVFVQKTDSTRKETTVMDYTNINNLADTFEVQVNGEEGIPTGTLSVYVRYSYFQGEYIQETAPQNTFSVELSLTPTN